MTNTQHIGFVILLAATLLGCKDPVPGPSAELLDLAITQVAGGPDDNPYKNVAFIRIAVNDGDGQLVTDKFVQYEPGGVRALDNIPFGQGLQIMIEGWSQNAQGFIGALVSRGKSQPFTLAVDSSAVDVNVVLARVNAFSNTTAPTDSGPQATGLNQGRVGHTVTLLNDGRVLICGGGLLSKAGDLVAPTDLKEVFDTAELYDPASGTFVPLPGAMTSPRAFHTATLLGDGSVLLAGGFTGPTGATTRTVEIFDPTSNTFNAIGTAELKTARAGHTTSLVEGSDHLVLAGGISTENGSAKVLDTIEVFCTPGRPCEASGVGTIYTGHMTTPRAFHTANRVATGSAATEAVVFTGGQTDTGVLDSLETFVLNPAGTAESTPQMLGGGRTRHTATYIDSQKFIHIVGGFKDLTHTEGVQRIDSYQVQSESFQGGQEFYALNPRGAHSAVLIPGNAILMFGGFHNGKALDTAEVIFEYYDKTSNQTFIDRGGVAPMKTPRGGHLGILLPTDTVLVVGGTGSDGSTIMAGEFFNPL